MSTAIAEDLKRSRESLNELDNEIAAKQSEFDETLAKAREAAEGDMVKLAQDDPDLAKAVSEQGKVLDDLKDTRLNAARAIETALADVKPATPSLGARGETIAEQILASAKDLGITAELLYGRSAIHETKPLYAMDRDETVARLKAGNGLFAAATADLSGGTPLDQRLYPPVDIRRRMIRLLDLITVGATDTESVVYARQTQRDSAAAPTALGTAYSEAQFDFEKVTASVESVGHFTTAYREQIADAAGFETLIESQLSEDVQLAIESQVLSGDGAGNDFDGILNSGIGVTHLATSERRVEALHRAMTVVRVTAFREPDYILLHPNDFQETLFEKTDSGDGGYVWIGALSGLEPGAPGNLWGKPVIVSPVAVEGTGLVGYWPDATLWVREGVNVRLSDSHSDYFTKRQVAILADMRAAFGVQRPSSFCKVYGI